MKKLSYIILIFITCIWGFSFPVITIALKYADPITFNAIRYISAAILMTIIFHKKIMLIQKEDFYIGLKLGIPFALGAILQIVGLEKSNITNSAFITGLNVVTVPLLIFLIERKIPTKKTILGISIAFIGMVVMSLLQGVGKTSVGDLIVFISTICFSFQIYWINKFAKNKCPYILTNIQLYIVGITAYISTFFFQEKEIIFNKEALLCYGYLILLSTILALTLQTIHQPHVATEHVGVIYLLEPVSATLLAFLLGDKIFQNQVVGALIICIGTFIILKHNVELEENKVMEEN